jgi:hypothetical protein
MHAPFIEPNGSLRRSQTQTNSITKYWYEDNQICTYITVTEFSKKTGDYPSLSATDIKVMALAYQLEKERVGTDHLKKEPQINRIVTFTHHLADESCKATAGFYSPCTKVCINYLVIFFNKLSGL